MNHELLKKVIYDQHQIIKDIKIVDREYDFDINANYVLVGLRRAGKSTLLYKIVQDLISNGTDWNQICYINFEDDRLAEFSIKDFNDIISVQSEMSDKKGWFFFDEIQNIEGWERFARRMADSKEHTFITGSNSSMLSQEIESRLGGRYITKYISPYNFREFLTAKNIDYSENAVLGTKTNAYIRRELKNYFYFGGFPESIQYANKREYVSSIYQKILLGDVAIRNGIRNTTGLALLFKKIGESVKDSMSFSKLHNILKSIGVNISKDAVIDYISYALDSFLLFKITNHFSKFVEKETTPKYYFNDNGLLNLFLFNEDSKLLENLVAINLYNNFKKEVYFLKSENIDIDFYVEPTGEVIQVAYSISQTAFERETLPLIMAAKKLKNVRRLIIITYEEEKNITIDGVTIEVIPIWKWLLIH